MVRWQKPEKLRKIQQHFEIFSIRDGANWRDHYRKGQELGVKGTEIGGVGVHCINMQVRDVIKIMAQ